MLVGRDGRRCTIVVANGDGLRGIGGLAPLAVEIELGGGGPGGDRDGPGGSGLCYNPLVRQNLLHIRNELLTSGLR